MSVPNLSYSVVFWPEENMYSTIKWSDFKGKYKMENDSQFFFLSDPTNLGSIEFSSNKKKEVLELNKIKCEILEKRMELETKETDDDAENVESETQTYSETETEYPEPSLKRSIIDVDKLDTSGFFRRT